MWDSEAVRYNAASILNPPCRRPESAKQFALAIIYCLLTYQWIAALVLKLICDAVDHE